MPVTFPIDNEFSNFELEVTLEGVSYTFQFTYNTRNLQWTMGVYDIDQVQIINGIKLVLNYDLFLHHPTVNLPPGELYCIDTTGDETEITRDNLGESIKMIYMTEEEVASV